MHATSIALPWNSLPAEMKFSVVELLDLQDVRSFATVNKEAYAIAVPSMWRTVDLKSLEALRAYLCTVPQSYHHYIRQLKISTKSDAAAVLAPAVTDCRPATDLLVELLSQCTQVEQLTLELEGSLTMAVIPCFENLHSLKDLSINHCGDEQISPLSERLVVSIAASVPNLNHLSLDRITRSAVHAPELIGAYPFVPVVCGDDDIPPHAVLGTELSLPSLLRLPNLKKLRLRDTHLGDHRWSITPVRCSLEVLDLGSCYHESPDFNRLCTERIVGTVGHTVDEFSLNTAISPSIFGHAKSQETPLKRLRKIHLTPLFPVENVVDTLTTLSGSPVEELSVQCHEDDVSDVCTALEDFLSLSVERGDNPIYQHLTKINVDAVTDIGEAVLGFGDEKRSTGVRSQHEEVVKQLQDYCRDLQLSKKADTAAIHFAARGPCGSVIKKPLVTGREH